MPTHLSRYLRERIVSLWKEGNSILSIVTILRSEGRVTLVLKSLPGDELHDELKEE